MCLVVLYAEQARAVPGRISSVANPQMSPHGDPSYFNLVGIRLHRYNAFGAARALDRAVRT